MDIMKNYKEERETIENFEQNGPFNIPRDKFDNKNSIQYNL